jgi:uncharacterized protein
MTQIAYTARVCADQEHVDDFLRTQRVGVLGLSTDQYPYSVPVNYLWLNGSVYFHSMGSGRKVDLLRGGPPASFTVFAEHGTAVDPVPCHADTAYTSVMIFGRAEEVTEPEEAAEALQGLVEKLMPGYYRNPVTARMVQHYRSGMDGNAVAVFRISPEHLSAKENRVAPADLFTAPSND